MNAQAEEEPGDQGEVIWQNPIRVPSAATNAACDPITRLARVVRHRVYDTIDVKGRADEIFAEVFGRDARGRARWEDAGDLEPSILKAALMSAHMILDAHREDERRARARMISDLRARAERAPDALPEQAGPESILCMKPIEGEAYPCDRAVGHEGACEPAFSF